jgi:phenylacetate-coenzyme A ligase PaaK-like adenylate-forming protein
MADVSRSLDLTLEILENAGASVLSAGNYMDLAEITTALAHYRSNVLSGDGSQVIRVIHYISMLPAEERQRIKLDKIIYTSEPLTPAQRAYITLVLGQVKIYSLLGSSEAGPWALSCPNLTGDGCLETPGAADFVFDTRTMLIEILNPSALDGSNDNASGRSEPLPDGSPGIIVQTSLQRLKNPLVRYVTGDVGSLHPLPESAAAAGVIPVTELEHFQVLRLHGRDQRFSFKWYGMYFEFDKLADLMQAEEWNILQWQVVLAMMDSSRELSLEARILLPSSNVGGGPAAESKLAKAIEDYFVVQPENRHLFLLAFAKDLTEFERSNTGGKVMHFVDKAH